MHFRRYFFFAAFTFLFLFYPGDSLYFNTFAYNRLLFGQKEIQYRLKKNPVPVVRYSYPPSLSSEGVYIVDLPSFTPLFERNATRQFYPASTSKIITALVAYDVFKPDDIVTITKTTTEGQLMGLVPGEKLSVESLLYGILVHSANDAAYALANAYGFDRFISLMNQKARDLAMENTQLKNPAGLDEFDQYITPYDLALAARALLNNSHLAQIAATKEIIILDTNFQYSHKLTNVNKLLGEIQGIGGLKTGYTESAGENLVSFYKKNGHQFIIVILKSTDRFSDTKNVVKWIDENVEYVALQ